MREKIQQVLDSAKNPVLLCSFGKDSLVLLKLVRDIKPEIPILWFRDHLDPFAARIIREWDLSVWGYAPTIRYQVDNTVVSEYAIGDARLPLLQDVSENGKSVGTMTTPQFSYSWSETLWGYKKSDSHPLVGRTLDADFQLGPTRMIAPLYDLSDEEVFALIDELTIPYQPICDDVLPSDLPNVPRGTFQARFGLN